MSCHEHSAVVTVQESAVYTEYNQTDVAHHKSLRLADKLLDVYLIFLHVRTDVQTNLTTPLGFRSVKARRNLHLLDSPELALRNGHNFCFL